jgi:hypothetical protein
VPNGSEPYLPARGERLRRCHMSYGSLWAVSLKHKENLASLPMQIGSCVFKPCMHVFKAPDVGAIMGI